MEESMKKKRLPYKKMIEAIDEIVNNAWGFEMIDCHVDTKFTQKEAQEMSKALGRIYKISHCLYCCCFPNL